MYEREYATIIDYIKSNHPLFFIQHSDYFAIKEIAEKLHSGKLAKFDFYEYTNISGGIKLFQEDDYDGDRGEGSLAEWLKLLVMDDKPQIVILKDVSNYFGDSKFISSVKQIAEKSIVDKSFTKIIIIYESSSFPFPRELESLITVVDINPLEENEIMEEIRKFSSNNDVVCNFLGNEEHEKKFANSFKGLQKFQIEQILNTAKAKTNTKNSEGKKVIQTNDIDTILSEKKQLIKKSGILEIIDKPGKIDDIGGLEELKKWLKKKAVIFQDIYEAAQHGVCVPKGILIVGMPGCGKSLTAKATATLFNVPLVRLDIGSLLGKYVGESEGNMKKALALSEAFAPCVLWIDELEKAFSGIQNGGEGNETVTRLFGQFLTWMQEKESPVFIVATANSISNLPPEFLRKGRFDELFKVELPNEKELAKIIEIKLMAKKATFSQKEIEELAKIAYKKSSKDKDANGGCNGGDIESIINEATENRYVKWKSKESPSDKLCFDDVKSVLESSDTKSVSQTLEKKIKDLREKLNEYPFRNASAQ